MTLHFIRSKLGFLFIYSLWGINTPKCSFVSPRLVHQFVSVYRCYVHKSRSLSKFSWLSPALAHSLTFSPAQSRYPFHSSNSASLYFHAYSSERFLVFFFLLICLCPLSACVSKPKSNSKEQQVFLPVRSVFLHVKTHLFANHGHMIAISHFLRHSKTM